MLYGLRHVHSGSLYRGHVKISFVPWLHRGSQTPYRRLTKVSPRTIRYHEVPVSMRQTLGKMTLGPLVNPSKFGCDGKAINTIHCFTTILDQTKHCTNADCEGSHVPPIRQVFNFILSLQAEHHYENGDVDDTNRKFLFNVLKAYFLKHFRHKTLPVITRPRRGKQLNAYPRDLQYRFRVKCTVPSNIYQGTIIKDMLEETEWLKQIEDKLPPQPGLVPMRRWQSTYRLLRQLPRPLAHQVKRICMEYREAWAACIQHSY